MGGSVGFTSFEIFRTPAEPRGGPHPYGCAPKMARTACIGMAVAGVTAMIAHLPTQATANTIHTAAHRAAAGSIQSAHLDPDVPRAVKPTIDLPDVMPGFGEAEPTVIPREPKVTVYRADSPHNFELKLRLNPTSDDADCEVALRLSSPRDYDVVRVDGRGRRVAFSRVREGRAEELASVERRVAADDWHSLRVEAEGDNFTVTLDEERLFTAYDDTLRRSGSLAVWTMAGGAVRFDAIALTALAPE